MLSLRLFGVCFRQKKTRLYYAFSHTFMFNNFPPSLVRPSCLLTRPIGLHDWAPSMGSILKLHLSLLAFRQFKIWFLISKTGFLKLLPVRQTDCFFLDLALVWRGRWLTLFQRSFLFCQFLLRNYFGEFRSTLRHFQKNNIFFFGFRLNLPVLDWEGAIFRCDNVIHITENRTN